MKKTILLFCCLVVLFMEIGTGCSNTVHEVYKDMAENQYLAQKSKLNPNAEYIGVWTGNTSGGLTSIKIFPDGTALYCQTNLSGAINKSNAKIFEEKNHLFMIIESGLKFKIDSYSKEKINISAYGENYYFIPGVMSLNCEGFIAK